MRELDLLSVDGMVMNDQICHPRTLKGSLVLWGMGALAAYGAYGTTEALSLSAGMFLAWANFRLLEGGLGGLLKDSIAADQSDGFPLAATLLLLSYSFRILVVFMLLYLSLKILHLQPGALLMGVTLHLIALLFAYISEASFLPKDEPPPEDLQYEQNPPKPPLPDPKKGALP